MRFKKNFEATGAGRGEISQSFGVAKSNPAILNRCMEEEKLGDRPSLN